MTKMLKSIKFLKEKLSSVVNSDSEDIPDNQDALKEVNIALSDNEYYDLVEKALKNRPDVFWELYANAHSTRR